MGACSLTVCKVCVRAHLCVCVCVVSVFVCVWGGGNLLFPAWSPRDGKELVSGASSCVLSAFYFLFFFLLVGLAVRFSAKRRTERGLSFSNGLRRKGDEVFLNAYVNKSRCMLVFWLQL